MLFQEPVITDLKIAIETHQHEPMWKALLHCIDHKELFGASMSEYEIYFNHSLLRSNQFNIRKLNWANSSMAFFNQYRALLSGAENNNDLTQPNASERNLYHYLSVHAHMR